MIKIEVKVVFEDCICFILVLCAAYQILPIPELSSFYM